MIRRPHRGTNNRASAEVDLTAEELVEIYQTHVPSEAGALAASYFRRSLRVSGVVRDVVATAKGAIVRFDRRGPEPKPRVEMLFDRSAADEIRSGDQVTIIGTIVEVNRAQVTLDHCRADLAVRPTDEEHEDTD